MEIDGVKTPFELDDERKLTTIKGERKTGWERVEERYRHLVADWLNANGYKVYEWGTMHSLSLEEAEMQEKELMEISEPV